MHITNLTNSDTFFKLTKQNIVVVPHYAKSSRVTLKFKQVDAIMTFVLISGLIVLFYLQNVVGGHTAKPLLDLHERKQSFFCVSWSFPSLQSNKTEKKTV